MVQLEFEEAVGDALGGFDDDKVAVVDGQGPDGDGVGVEVDPAVELEQSHTQDVAV